ncbi:MAG: LysR family transcriptional regulator [Actinomycetota bacterium]|nr:LysR family transcriptional regulator [Actinomycetota bacterium]
MELRQLEYFVAVAEEANFTRAAARVHITQSGISAQVRQLEADLGAPLIDRSGRSATLTAAGAAALPHARAALGCADALRQAVDEVNGLIRGHLVVGMVTACTVTPLFDVLAAFHLAHPGIAITVVEDHSDRLVERVRSGEADLALVGVADGPPGDLESLPITSERLAAAAVPDHPLAARARTTLAGLSAFPLVCMPAGTGVRAVLDQACAAQGLRADIALEASAPATVVDLAARGLGVAVLTESMVASQPERLRAIAIEDIQVPAVLALVWNKSDSPALRELVHHSRRWLDSADPAQTGLAATSRAAR